MSGPSPWRRLSRDARDTLFLIGVIGWTLAPQLPQVPTWCALYALAALAWRARLALIGAPLPGRAWMLTAVALAAAGTFWSHHSLIGKESGLTLLVVLAALKTLELRARRDAVVVFFLGFVLVLAAFLRSQSLGTALAMALSVLGLLTALALAHMPGGRPSLRSAAALTLRNALIGTPLVVLLFVFFPRLPPLWGVPAAPVGQTGLSDELQLGQVAELASDERLAMRLRFADGAPPPPEQRYFRGPVLSRSDGPRWRAEPAGIEAAPGPDALAAGDTAAPPRRYTAWIEPGVTRSLPLPEFTLRPPTVDGLDEPPQPRRDGQWLARQPWATRLQVQGEARLQDHLPAATPGAAPSAAETALPPGRHPRTRAWALAWAATLRRDAALGAGPTDDPQDRFAVQASAALLAHIRRGGYQYTLAPGLPEDGADPLDAFWLDQREGFCEHYAVAFVVVMRSLGVPARIVTGYQGGQPNALDGWLDLRQSDAHAWAEVWQPGRGWLRVDPTAAVAPDRIRLGQRLRPPPGLVAGALDRVDPALLERLRQFWRAADHRWSEAVLQYGRQRQADLLRRIGWENPDLFAAARTLLIALALLGLGGAAWAAWDGRRRRQRDPWLRTLDAVQAELQRRGLSDASGCPPRSLAQAVHARWGASEAGQHLARLLLQLDAQRYAPPAHAAPPATELRELQPALRDALRRLPQSESQSGPRLEPDRPPPQPPAP